MPNSKSLQQKAFRMILVASIALLFVIGGINFVITSISTMQGYKRETAHDMRYAVSLIDADYLEKICHRVWERYDALSEDVRKDPYTDEYFELMKDLVDEDFWTAWDILIKCKEETELDSVSLLIPDTKRERLIYVIDGYDIDKAFIPGQWTSEEYSATDSPEQIKKILASDTLMYVDYGTVSGWIATNYIEVNDRNGNFLCYASSDINITGFIKRMFLQVVVYFVLLSFVVILLAWGLSRNMRRWMISPMNKLAKAAQDYTIRDKTQLDEGNVQVKEYFSNLDIKRTGDEVETLWNSLSDMEKDINDTMHRIREMTAEKERLSAELEVATKIQASMLPVDFPLFPDNKEFSLYASMDPAKAVGGDFYDAFMLDDDHVCMVVGDVSGKGVPAALFMVKSMTVIRNRAKSGGTPSEILADVNNVLCTGNSARMFVTVWLSILNFRTGELVESSAGHEMPVILKVNGDTAMLDKPHGLVLGVLEGSVYPDDIVMLEKGDVFFAYSDGLPDASNQEGKRLGKERMVEILGRYNGEEPKALLTHIKQEVNEYVKDAEQFDDLTMLSFRFEGGEKA